MILEIQNLKKSFALKQNFIGSSKGKVQAVDGISLDIVEGDSLGIVGESGSGKTTLARLICYLYPLDEGVIKFRGQVVDQPTKEYRKNVQIVFQDPYSSLDPRFTVRKIIKEGMHLNAQKIQTPQEQELYAQELMEAVGLTHDMLGRYPHEFSGGERQRIAIARALAVRPKLLLLDEAVSSLDVIMQDQILTLLKDLQVKFSLTYIFISHNLKAVQKICNRIAVMYQGRIVEMASADQILNQAQHPYTRQLLSAALNYQVKDNQEIVLSKKSRLIDQGNGHFVLE